MAEVLEQKLKFTVRTADPSQHGNPKEAFGALEIENVKTSKKTENKSNPDDILFIGAEPL